MRSCARYIHVQCQRPVKVELTGQLGAVSNREACAGWAVNFACMCREKYVGGPTNSVTRKELGALFDVTGTPSWRDVEGVQSATWRNYLQRLPGRAPTLFRRLGLAGDAQLIQGDALVLLSSTHQSCSLT